MEVIEDRPRRREAMYNKYYSIHYGYGTIMYEMFMSVLTFTSRLINCNGTLAPLILAQP